MNNIKIAILGYYGKKNLGDEAFMDSFHFLLKDSNLEFFGVDIDKNIDVTSHNIIICGGGDVINEYFLPKFEKILDGSNSIKLFYGVGIPYTSYISLKTFKNINHIFLRNACDIPLVSFYSNNVKYIPDIVFSLSPPKRCLERKKRIGVFFHVGLIKGRHKDNTIHNLNKALNNISKYGKIMLYPFNTSESPIEDDTNVNNLLDFESYNKTFTTKEMLKEIGTLDYAICARFHAHVMCTIAATPFISISTTRKTRLYMKEIMLEKYMVQPKIDESDYIISIDHNTIIKTFEKMLKDFKLSLYLSKISENRRNIVRNVSNITKLERNNPGKTKLENIFTYIEDHVNDDDVCNEICYMITGKRNSKYLWGFKESMNKDPTKYKKKIEWIVNDFYSV